MNASHKIDLMKGALILTCSFFIKEIDTSRLYHLIRGQTIIRLHVIFGVLEIMEKLCGAFGHDSLDALFDTSRLDLAASKRRSSRIIFFFISVLYISFHTLILFYQVMCLNVAINSYNNVLLTLLLSNQFVEIKGSVFKRFEVGNLFQLACADVAERFQLSVFLAIITARNCIELLGDGVFGDMLSYSK